MISLHNKANLCSASSTLLSAWHCQHLLLSAVMRPRAESPLLLHGRRSGRMMRQTDKRTSDRYIDFALHMRAVLYNVVLLYRYNNDRLTAFDPGQPG